MTVRDIMTLDPECCTATSGLQEVARLMVTCDCGEIPVCDDAYRPIGVITDRDIVCRIVAKGENPSELTAADCMSSPVITTTPDTDIAECVQLMERHRLRRLPVVDAGGECCGMVAQADLARKAPHETTIRVVEKVSEPTAKASGAER